VSTEKYRVVKQLLASKEPDSFMHAVKKVVSVLNYLSNMP
jgi:hypothetical protein